MNSKYLSAFARRHSKEEALEYISGAQELDVLVIGEAIVDEYQYCRAIGKSSKEPMLAVRHLSTERFAGGSVAIARHLASFCGNLGLIRRGGPVVKRRFIDDYSFTKILEVYKSDAVLNENDRTALSLELAERLPKYRLVVVADFGHGMLDDNAVGILCEKASFLAVNTQANAGNWGFHAISKYSRADYICIAEQELRLEARDRHGDLKEMVLGVSRKLGCERVIITRGGKGCLSYDAHEGFFEIPSMATKVVDRMGAGDTFFAISSLLAVQAAPIEVMGFVGNVAGALSVETIGHRKYLTKEALVARIEALYA